MRTETEIKSLLDTFWGKDLLTDSQKKILEDETVPDIFDPEYKGEVPAEETDRQAIAWKYGRISTGELFGKREHIN